MQRRKRSHWIWLGLVGAGTGILLLDLRSTDSDDTVDGNLFTSVDQCAASGRYDRAACSDAFADAQRQRAGTAPRYASLADCEAEFARGGCTSLAPSTGAATSTAGAIFIPAMAGVLIGSGVAGLLKPNVAPAYQTCSPDPGRQDCRGMSAGSGTSAGIGHYYSGTGYRLWSNGGSSVSASRAAFSGSSATTTLARGGFGARAAAVGGHGRG